MTAKSVFRYWEDDGIPSSGKHRVKKSEVQELITGLEVGLANVGSTVLTPGQYGAVGFTADASPGNDTGAVLAMLSAAPIGVDTYLAKSYNVTSYQNFNAVKFTGPGEIVTMAAANSPALLAGLARLNWGNDANMDVFGEEYLYAVRKEIEAGNNIPGTIFGDSTFASPSSVVLKAINYPENALGAIVQDIGLPTAFFLTNLAKGGTTFDDAINGNTKNGSTVISNLGPTKKLLVFKDGLNEANSGSPGYPVGGAPRPAGLQAALTELKSKMRAGFASIRSHMYGNLDATSIIYFGPNAAQNTGYQDLRWLELAIPVIKQICREYQVMYIDTYRRWADAYTSNYRWTDGAWVDYPTNTIPGFGPLHLNDIGWAMVWGAVRHYLGFALATLENRTNGFINPPYSATALPFSALPSAFKKGISQFEVAAADGWPANGMVRAYKSGSGARVTQVLEVDGSGTSFSRRKSASTDTWTAFTGSQATITLTASWVQDATGTALGCTRDVDGRVVLRGAIKSGTVTSGTDFGTLPAGYRPSSIEAKLGGVLTQSGGTLGIGIRTNGTMYWIGTANATWTSLDGLSFYP